MKIGIEIEVSDLNIFLSILERDVRNNPHHSTQCMYLDIKKQIKQHPWMEMLNDRLNEEY